MDIGAVARVVVILVAAEVALGHGLLFVLFHHGAKLHPSTAIRLGHVLGFALGYAAIAAWLPGGAMLVFWAGALLPGAAIFGAFVVWLSLVLFLPPGLSGPHA